MWHNYFLDIYLFFSVVVIFSLDIHFLQKHVATHFSISVCVFYKFSTFDFHHCLSCRCYRILWYGKGLKQISYGRGESKLSDHRPVYSVFMAEVDMLNRSDLTKAFTSSGARFHVEKLPPQTQNSLQIPKIYVRICPLCLPSLITTAKNSAKINFCFLLKDQLAIKACWMKKFQN